MALHQYMAQLRALRPLEYDAALLLDPIMAHSPEPYHPRHIAHIDTWRDTGFAIKVYGIHHQDVVEPMFSDDVVASVRAAVNVVLNEHARDERSLGLGFCVAHFGQEAVWLLVDWWISGGIVCQKMLSAPLARPDMFTPINTPALACVWELVVITHERDAWVRHMLSPEPDADAYLRDIMPAGRY